MLTKRFVWPNRALMFTSVWANAPGSTTWSIALYVGPGHAPFWNVFQMVVPARIGEKSGARGSASRLELRRMTSSIQLNVSVHAVLAQNSVPAAFINHV